MSLETTPQIHISLRFKRFFRDDETFEKFDSTEEHNRIFKAKNQVLLAKFGRAPSRSKIEQVCEQAKGKGETRVYLLFREKREFQCYAAKVSGVFLDKPSAGQHPEYYQSVELDPSCWFVLASPIKPVSIDNLVLAKPERPLTDVLRNAEQVCYLLRRHPRDPNS